MHASGGVGPLKKMKKLHSVRGSIFQSWQHLSDWSSGPKHFTIFSKNCWTVENHLIRETTHTSSGAKSVLQTVDPTGEKKKKRRRRKKQQLELISWKDLSAVREIHKNKQRTDRLRALCQEFLPGEGEFCPFLEMVLPWCHPSPDWVTCRKELFIYCSGAMFIQAFHSERNEAHAGLTGWAGFHQQGAP